jgi:hypothetical protein
MQWFATLVNQGGPTVLMIFALVIPGLALVGVHIGMRRRWSLFVSLGVIALILGIGVFGMMMGRSRTDSALGSMEDEQDRLMMREAGYSEAYRPMQVAGVIGGILVVGVVVAQLRKREPR